MKKYRSNTTTIPDGTTNAPILSTLFGSNWRDDIAGRASVFLIRYNANISFRLYTDTNDEIRSLNAQNVPSSIQFEDLFNPLNQIWPIDEIYVTNNSGITCTIDVLVMPNRLK